MRIRVAIIGLSDSWSRRYLPALRALQDRFEVRGIYAPVGLLADKAARVFRVPASRSFQQLIRRPDVDAVLVLASDGLGPLPLLVACEAGKAVYSAAHLELDAASAAELREQVDRSGIAFMAEFTRRHAPATLRLKELIATHLGPPQLLFCHHCSSGRRRPGRPGSRPPASTHRLSELVDWSCYVVGRSPTSVWGDFCRLTASAHDHYRSLSLHFAPGAGGSRALAQIRYGNYLPPQWSTAKSFRPPPHMEVRCERGIAYLDLPATLVWFDEAGQHQESLEDERPVGEQLLMHFHRAVTSLVRKRSDLEDAFRALRIVSVAKRSAALGRRIRLP